MGKKELIRNLENEIKDYEEYIIKREQKLKTFERGTEDYKWLKRQICEDKVNLRNLRSHLKEVLGK